MPPSLYYTREPQGKNRLTKTTSARPHPGSPYTTAAHNTIAAGRRHASDLKTPDENVVAHDRQTAAEHFALALRGAALGLRQR
jgi:hypothetical protein